MIYGEDSTSNREVTESSGWFAQNLGEDHESLSKYSPNLGSVQRGEMEKPQLREARPERNRLNDNSLNNVGKVRRNRVLSARLSLSDGERRRPDKNPHIPTTTTLEVLLSLGPALCRTCVLIIVGHWLGRMKVNFVLAALGVAHGMAAESSYDHAVRLMEASPLIDTHVDLPQILRSLGENQGRISLTVC